LSSVTQLSYSYSGTTVPLPGDLSLNLPIDTTGEFEAPLSITPKAIDFKGRYAAPLSIDAKLGALRPLDPLGKIRLEVTSDQYSGGPQTRRLLQSRTVDMTAQKAGVDEWRRYALGRLRAVQVAAVRLTFPRNQHPKRTNRIVILRRAPGFSGNKRKVKTKNHHILRASFVRTTELLAVDQFEVRGSR
jgi:hypothetical protein